MARSSAAGYEELLAGEDGRFHDDHVYLALGIPGHDLLSGMGKLLIDATKHRLSIAEEEVEIFQYGGKRGFPPFRDELALFLTDHYGSAVTSENICAIAGATSGLDFLTRALFPPGTPCFIENPTFFISISMLQKSHKYNLIPVCMAEEGIDLDELERVLKQTKSTHPAKPDGQLYWGMLYHIALYSNPTGHATQPDQCRRLVNLAREYDLLIVCDDIYSLLHLTEEKYPPLRLFAYDEKTDKAYKGGNVVSIGSFSKIFAPGLRLGWLEAPTKVLKLFDQVDYLITGGCPANYQSAIFTSVMQLGFATTHLHRVRKVLKKRKETMGTLLRRYLPTNIKFKEPEGGYFYWLELPNTLDAKDVIKTGKEKHKVDATPGHIFNSGEQKGLFKNYLRISFAYYDEEKLKEGVKRLAAAIQEHLP